MNIENIGHRFTKIVNTSEWEELQNKYNKCNDIFNIDISVKSIMTQDSTLKYFK